MDRKTGRKSGFWFSIGLIFALLFFVTSFLTEDISNFYSHLHSFSYGVRNYDRDQALQSLEDLKEDYIIFSAWKLQYFADRLLFNKMYRYEAAVSILNDDFEKVETEDLENREDDYYASYMLGIAKFKALHSAFQQAMVKKDKKQMAAILNLVLEQVKPDFERCVKKGPGPGSNFNCSFDYDLASDPKSAQKALMNQKTKPQFVLGLPDGQSKKPGDKEPDKKGSPRLSSSEKKDAGQGGAKKVG